MRFGGNFQLEKNLGIGLALVWIASTAPDLLATYFGDRANNSISFTPAWLKAIRDIYTVCTFLYFSRKLRPGSATWRLAGLVIACIFVGIGISRGTDIPVAVRGVLWIPAIIWMATASMTDIAKIKYFLFAAFRILIPASIIVSVVLGVFGANMYYEGVGFYQRNPGMMLSPSATAYLACMTYLMLHDTMRNYKNGALTAGVLSLSGVFYVMALLLFGRLQRVIYLILLAIIIGSGLFLGIDGLIDAMSGLSGGVRSDDAVSITLGTRLLIVLSGVSDFTLAGNFPVGLNVAANQELEVFFPDNAILAVAYAFGLTGVLGFLVLMIAAYRIKKFGVFLLIFVSSFFYVWFENTLLAGITGLAINKHFWKQMT